MNDPNEWVRVYKESLRTQYDIFTVYYVDGVFVITRIDARNDVERERWEVNTNGV